MNKLKFLTILLPAVLVAGCCGDGPRNASDAVIASTRGPEFKLTGGQVYVTAKGTAQRLSDAGALRFEPFGQPEEIQPFVFVEPRIEFQNILGIGGAITDASAETWVKLPQARRDEIIKAYFDPEQGIGYNFTRVNIASCDFSSGTYSYIEPGDTELKTFSIAHDEQYRLPMVKAAQAMIGDNLLVMASPWSPPGWMKSNNDPLQGGTLLDEYKQPWANHYIKFIDAYKEHGVDIWGISVQNETMAIQTWESCVFTAEQERDYIRDYVGPTLKASSYPDTKLIAWDHNRDLIFQRAATIMADPEAAKYVWGFGFHWYEPWTGGQMQFDNLYLTKQAFPDKELIFTEGCVEDFDFGGLGRWDLGERYGHSMLHDFNCGTTAWIDWNILLDETGGPNHVGNLCFAPVHGDTRTGEVIYTNSYYYIGHFSKFIKRGARRIAVSSSRYDLEATGFRNPNGELVLVFLNRSEAKIDFKLGINGEAADVSSQPRSIMTVVLR